MEVTCSLLLLSETKLTSRHSRPILYRYIMTTFLTKKVDRFATIFDEKSYATQVLAW